MIKPSISQSFNIVMLLFLQCTQTYANVCNFHLNTKCNYFLLYYTLSLKFSDRIHCIKF